ncbi:unnamed protein product [Anisakis simplex]|uniref:Uncharacterized protein n=1 Tax=Anisakis simplex TaxID=6269 RepID=A0A0M3JMC6_ANISI|nr:unnamed protein product [Anisakis simplex]
MMTEFAWADEEEEEGGERPKAVSQLIGRRPKGHRRSFREMCMAMEFAWADEEEEGGERPKAVSQLIWRRPKGHRRSFGH